MRIGIVITAGVLLLAGRLDADDSAVPPPVEATSRFESPADARMAWAVELSLADLPPAMGRHVRVHARGNVVTLSGLVPGPLAHGRVLLAARAIEGVENVRDELEFDPLRIAAELSRRPAPDTGTRAAAALRALRQPGGLRFVVAWDGTQLVLGGRVGTFTAARRALAAVQHATAYSVRVRPALEVDEDPWRPFLAERQATARQEGPR